MKKYALTALLFTGLFVISATISYFVGIYKNIYVKGSEGVATTPAETGTPTPTPDPLGPKNVLILGYGGVAHADGSLLTDTIIVAHIEPRNNKVNLISVPRDTLIPLEPKADRTQNFKINHAYAIGLDDRNYPQKDPKYDGLAGGGLMAKEAVGKVTGLDIDYYVSVDFIGFVNIVDILGGVNVYVPYTFTDNYYPIQGEEDNPCGKSEQDIAALTATMSGELLEKEFPCRFEELHFDTGQLTMDGQTALKFVRSRHSDIGGSDFGRAQRQQAFLVAVKNKLLSYKSITKIIPVINTLSKNLKTDIDIASAIDLWRDQGGLSDIEIDTTALTTDNILKETYTRDGQYVLIPKAGEGNWQEVHDFVADAISTD